MIACRYLVYTRVVELSIAFLREGLEFTVSFLFIQAVELYSRQLSLIIADPVLDQETVLYSLFSIQPGRGATLFLTIESEKCRPSPGPRSCPLQETALQVLIFTPYFEQREQ